MLVSVSQVGLLLGVVFSVVTATHDGCTARQHVGSTLTLGAVHDLRLWHDPASPPSTPLLTVTLTSGPLQHPDNQHGHYPPMPRFNSPPLPPALYPVADAITNDFPCGCDEVKWELHRHRLKTTITASGNKTSSSLTTVLAVPPGWNSFHLSLLDPPSLSLLQGDEYVPLLPSLPEANLRLLDMIQFSGSNITLDCYKGFTRWRVSGGPRFVTLPLTPGDVTRYRQSIHLHSTARYEPVFRLGSSVKFVQLGWDYNNQDVVANSSNSLPTRRLVKLLLQCEEAGSGNFLCQFLRWDETPLTDGFLVEPPLMLMAGAYPLYEHYFIKLAAEDGRQDGRQRALAEAGSAQTTPTSGSPAPQGCSRFSAVLVTLLVTATLVLIVVLVLKLVFGATLVYRPKIKGLSWVVQSSAPAEDCELGTWPQQQDQEKDALLEDTTKETAPKEDWRTASLWVAVSDGVIERIPQLLREGADPDAIPSGRDTSSMQEAHLRTNSAVLAAVRGSPDPPENEVVKALVPILKSRIEQVFTAAADVGYSGVEGVAAALQQSGVCATVRDSKGRSILHCALQEDPNTGLPRWSVEDIRKFLQDNTVLCNAVDFQGNTPLHTLASHASLPTAAEETRVEAAWLACAEEVLRRGADPTLPNAEGHNPLDIAQVHAHGRLLQLFSQHKPASGRRSHLFNTAADAELEQCGAVLKAATLGSDDMWRHLQARRGPPDQVLGGGCPLALSVMHELFDVSSLLLSVGASPCGGRGITALLAAHTTQGLPGLFAAQLRLACYDQLNWEATRAPQDIAWRLRTLSDQLLEEGPSTLKNTDEGGPDVKMPEQTTVEELTKLAEAGLMFSCQVYCQEYPICTYYQTNLDVDNPVEKAIKAGKTSLAVAMCKNTSLTPFPEMSYSEVPSEVSDSLLLSDLKLLDDFITSRADTDDALFNFCYELKINGKVSKYPPLTAWKSIARLGLQNIFHRIMEDHFLDANSILDPSLGFTLLHYSAAYGQLSMIRSLKSLGYNPNLKAVHGATPYHLCLVKAHWECVEYFRSWEAKAGELFNVSLVNLALPELRIAAFERINSLPVLKKQQFLQVLCEKTADQRRVAILRKILPQLKKDNTMYLVQLYHSWADKSTRLLMEIRSEIENLLLKIAVDCPAMKCTVKKSSFVKDIHSYTMEFLYHVEADKATFVRHKYVENCNIHSLMMDTFQAVVRTATHDPRISCKDPSATFVYPKCKTQENGPAVYMIKHYENKLFRIKSVLIIESSENSEESLLPSPSSNSQSPEVIHPHKTDLLNACLVLCSGQKEKLSVTVGKGSWRDTVPKPLSRVNIQLAEALLTLILDSHSELWSKLGDVPPATSSTLHFPKDNNLLLHQSDPKCTSSRSDLLNVSSCTDDVETAQNMTDESTIKSEVVNLAWHKALLKLLELATSAATDRSSLALLSSSPTAVKSMGLGDVKQAFDAASTFLHHLH